jgi:hypothetical protein
MRPTFVGRRFFGASAFVLLGLMAAPRAYANSQEGTYSVVQTDDDDEAFAKQVTEVELGLNQLLLVDEDKKVHVRKEFQESLPMPPAQVERMLQMAVKVGDDGKIHLRNPEQIRPFLPQIQAFMKNGNLQERLKEFQKKTPEERKAEMQKLLRDQNIPGMPRGEDDDEDDRPRARPAPGRGQDRPGPDRGGPEQDRGRGQDRGPQQDRGRGQDRGPQQDRGRGQDRGDQGEPRARGTNGRALEERIARLEQSVQNLERLVRQLADRGGNRGEREGRGDERPRWQETPWGWQAQPGQGSRDRRRERDLLPDDEMRRALERARSEFDRARSEFDRRMRERFGDRSERDERDRDDRGGRGLHDERDGERRLHDDRDDRGREDRGRGGDFDPRRMFENLRREFERRFEGRGGDNRERDRGDRGGRRERDRNDDDDSFQGSDVGGALRDIGAGLRKVNEVLTREDWDMIARTLRRFVETAKPEDLSDQERLMEKLQAAVDPADMPRFLEIAGEILGSPEGRAMQARFDSMIRRFEKFSQSEQGQRLERSLARGGNGNAQRIRGTIDKLFKGERPESPAKKQGQNPERKEAPKDRKLAGAPSDGANPTRPAGARLY